MADRYQVLPYRRCGRSGLPLPAGSLGAWETFGGYRGAEVAPQVLFPAFDLGITPFDFANNYGNRLATPKQCAGRSSVSYRVTSSSFQTRLATACGLDRTATAARGST